MGDISIHAPHTGRDVYKPGKIVALTPFQSTRPIRGATYAVALVLHVAGISIHAPHTGRDQSCWAFPHALWISIHAPHTGRDDTVRLDGVHWEVFQSTRPIRGATWRPAHPRRKRRNFNPRAPYGARHTRLRSSSTSPVFQSTRPIRGATAVTSEAANLPEFQSTRPIRGATPPKGDSLPSRRDFNPRASYGARL